MRTSLADDSSIDEMPSLWRHTRQIKEKEKIMFSKDDVIKCSQCGCELEDVTDEFYDEKGNLKE